MEGVSGFWRRGHRMNAKQGLSLLLPCHQTSAEVSRAPCPLRETDSCGRWLSAPPHTRQPLRAEWRVSGASLLTVPECLLDDLTDPMLLSR